MFIRNFNLRSSQARRKRKFGLNHSLMYIHPFPPILTPVFLFAPLQLSSQEKTIFRQKKYWGAVFSPSQLTPMAYTMYIMMMMIIIMIIIIMIIIIIIVIIITYCGSYPVVDAYKANAV
jgi:hypothetical protein